MKRPTAAFLAAALLASTLSPAARAHAQAAEPFPEVPLPHAAARSHAGAYAAFLAGAGLIGASFVIGDRANDAYAEYLAATDPDRIEDRFERTRRLDGWATATLLAGEALVGAGIYLRFLRPSAEPGLALIVGPERCAFSLRF